MNESTLWEWLRDVALPIGNYDRIEAPDTAPGHPDVRYTIKSDNPFYDDCISGTIELKYSSAQAVPFPDEDKGLHKSQRTWMRREVRHCGKVWIIAEVLESIYVIPGKYFDQFNGATRQQLEDIAEAVIYRDQPGHAAAELKRVLVQWIDPAHM